MIYVAAALCIALIALFCFVLPGLIGSILFAFYRTLGLASEREAFLRSYRLFARVLGVVLILILLVGVVVKAST
jgi:ethanolamine transporter EutH